MSDDDNQLALIFATTIALVAILGRLVGGSWRHPAALFAAYWFLTSSPALVAIPDEVDPAALLLIVLFSLAVFAGTELGRAHWAGSSCADSAGPPALSGERSDRLHLIWIVGLLSVCGFGANLLYLGEGQATLASLLSFEGWIENAAYFSIARYFDDYVEPLPLRVLSAMNYCGALLGGVLMAVGTRRLHRVLAVLPLLFGVLMTVITTAKAGSLLCTLFFVSSYGAMTCNDGRNRVEGATFPAIAGVAALGGVTILAMVLRYGPDDSFAAGLLGERLASYIFGHMAALSAWLDWDGVAATGPLFGLRSFAGIAEALDLTQRTPGLYAAIPRGIVAGGTNVFTAFRGLIEDFTLPGAFLVMGCSSSLAGYAFEVLRSGRRSPYAIVTLAGFYAFIGWSAVINVFMYNVVVLAFGVFTMVMLYLRIGVDRSGHLSDIGRTAVSNPARQAL